MHYPISCTFTYKQEIKEFGVANITSKNILSPFLEQRTLAPRQGLTVPSWWSAVVNKIVFDCNTLFQQHFRKSDRRTLFTFTLDL
jgi:hypothetical protein